MSIIHIAFYPSDWLAGTRGLSAEETGVYITLIARMYEMAGPIERDDRRLHRLCGTKSPHQFRACLSHLLEEGKIIEEDGLLFNERVTEEVKKVVSKSHKSRSAAEARWRKKPRKNNGSRNTDASVGHMPQLCQSESEESIVGEGARADQKKRHWSETAEPDDPRWNQLREARKKSGLLGDE